MAEEEDKKNDGDKGDHINLKVKDQVRRGDRSRMAGR
jgi:hypothetical protein